VHENAVGDNGVGAGVTQHRQARPADSLHLELPFAFQVLPHPLAHVLRVVDRYEFPAAADQVPGQPPTARTQLDNYGVRRQERQVVIPDSLVEQVTGPVDISGIVRIADAAGLPRPASEVAVPMRLMLELQVKRSQHGIRRLGDGSAEILRHGS
jgi:hypothetical protein